MRDERHGGVAMSQRIGCSSGAGVVTRFKKEVLHLAVATSFAEHVGGSSAGSNVARSACGFQIAASAGTCA